MVNSGWKKIKDLKKGDYFTHREYSNPPMSAVHVRSYYCPRERKFSHYAFTDICHNYRPLNGDTLVYVGFTF